MKLLQYGTLIPAGLAAIAAIDLAEVMRIGIEIRDERTQGAGEACA